MASAVNCLGQSALYQLVAKNDRLSQDEAKDLMKKVEETLKGYEKKGKASNGRITVDLLYEAFKKKNGIEITKADIRALIVDLDVDKENTISIKDFAKQPIISEAVFYSIDRNKDGYITKGELKLACKGFDMKKLSEIISEIDKDNDGKLTFDEVKEIAKRAHRHQNKATSKSSKPSSKSSKK